MDLSPYTLHILHKSGELVVFRGRDQRRTSAHPPSVLVVMARSEDPGTENVQMMEHEYSLRAELDPAWAVRPIALTQHAGRSVLVLEDPGGEPLDQLLGTPMETGQFLRVAVGLSAAVRQLHSRGLIHKDLKPTNLMIEPSTGQVWLMGFGIASRLARERQSAEPPEYIAGTLAYMAPEQTGRMNRSIDSRSDLYALGVTLYEIVTGTLPFAASDATEWVHCHIAKQPLPPAERRKDIPGCVSEIITKLLAKTAEERYQTAAGLERDLRRCLAQWEAQRRIDEFPLGERDTPDRLLIPEKLYGRQREVETLLASFDRVVNSGTPELVLVSGYSGIGKSSVVNELHKALVPLRGLFASGKFDQQKRDIPYPTLAEAFQSFVRRLLAKSIADLAPWRDALREALGPNGRLMTDLVPELKLIIGEQPPVPDLAPQDAQRRFQLVFRHFIGVFARREHPLVLFLDDLQWLDAATLELIEDLFTPAEVQYLLLIGAYRDNEVDAAHPLTRKLQVIKHVGAKIEEVKLVPLGREHLGQLIADALRCNVERVAPLAQLVHEKTAGNPFFAIQFLHALTEEGLLHFDHEAACWSWDLERIHAKRHADNVIELMVGKLARLPVEAQKALREMACLGIGAEITTLTAILGASEDQIHSALWEPMRLELVVRQEASYKFIHDRVQEAAYSLVPEGTRAAAHLRIGRVLAAHIPAERREEAIFEIVNQLNRGATLITSQEEREQLAELNLIAGKRAKAASAYASALNYLATGGNLLPEDSWERCYRLVFAIEINRAESEFLTGNLIAAEERLAVLAQRAANVVDRAATTRAQILLYTGRGRPDRAVEICLEYLREVGIAWSPRPTDEEVGEEYERMWQQLGDRLIEELFDLPLMSDQDWRATMEVLTELMSPAIFTDANLRDLLLLRMANMSIEHGNSDGSSYAYAYLNIVVGARFGNYRASLRFSQLSLDLVEKKGLDRFRARVYLAFGNMVIPWVRQLRTAQGMIRRALETALQTGDLTYAGYIYDVIVTNLLACGDPLEHAQREAEHGLQFAQKMRFGISVDIITGQLGFIKTVRGLTQAFGSFSDDRFDENRFEQYLEANPHRALPTCWYWIRKLQARFYSANYAEAVAAAAKAQRFLWTTGSFFEGAEYHFYGALARAAAFDCATPDEQREHLYALAEHHQRLTLWAENCPENFENRAALVGAEIARIEGRNFEAMRLYEQAIHSARDNGFVHNEALANEVAARFYAARGFEQIAHLYLRNARRCYLRWGADGKVQQLDQLYRQLGEELTPGPAGTIGVPIERMDLVTVLKVSQAVSGEIVLEKLIDRLLRTAVEHSGAERGWLILPRGAELRIQAEATTGDNSVIVGVRDAPISSTELPEPVVQYAARTLESVILDDASARGPFSDDECIRREQARSILCLPLVKQGRLIAVLYLENNLAANVFTPARIAVLNVLASAAAISLENSRLYRELQEREAKIRRLVDANIVGVLISNLEGQIIDANDAFLQMVRYTREDLTSGCLRWTELTPPEWRAVSERAVAQLRATGTCEIFEKEYFRSDGSRVPVLVAAATIGDVRSENVAFVLDLTERKHAEEALRQTQADLAHINRVNTLGELSASLAHELNQPIAATMTNAKTCLRWLARSTPDLQEAREAVMRIVKDAARATEIINRLRSLYKKGAPTEPESVDVNEVACGMLVLLRSEASRFSISMRTDFSTELPRIEADRVQLQQVFMNLMLNGIEAMKDTGGELTVKSEQTEAGDVLISIMDTGVGLPTEKVDQIFNAFFTTKSHGSGMGLSISRTIVEAHGGRLWATANPGRGATFQFTLPREAVASSPSVA